METIAERHFIGGTMIALEKLEEGVREDGTIDDCDFETFYARLEYLKDADGYLRVVGDDGPAFTEIRIPHEALEKIGWTKPAKEPLP